MNRCHASYLIVHTSIDFWFAPHAENRYRVRRLVAGGGLAKWYIHLN
jgi:hypothetical protein